MNSKDFERDLVSDIHTISGYSETDIKDMLDFLFINQAMQYYKDGKFIVPFWGTLEIIYEGEEYVVGKKQAKVSCIFHPSALLKLIVGEKIDNKATFMEQMIENKIKNSILSFILEENT